MTNMDPIILNVTSGQEIAIDSKGIVVKCNGGTVKIEMLKRGKINLYAEKEIQITADEEINIDTKSILRMQGKKEILLESVEGGSLNMDTEGHFIVKGIETHMN
ncbi:MAG: hypothetical protein HDR06_10345 [Lachnospiraceae bacterium]|nr:hypothetical protein [Lachnospiraceae bacterium]